MAADLKIVTFIAPVNIALIKYWGKRDEKLILPIASSLSLTLGLEEMCAKTTVISSKDFKEDTFWLNDKQQSMDNPRITACLAEVRRRSKMKGDLNDNHIRVTSVNNFPTAAGLASSAAGYACFVSALAGLYEVEGDISSLARLGSGSACRSIHGGFVEWTRGNLADGSDSIAQQVAPASHWPELRIFVLVVNDQQKTTSSTEGMRRSMENSEFLPYWAKECVPKQISQIKNAIYEKDFATLAELTMKASNQFHALCLETFPPIVYLNEVSYSIIQLVHQFNSLRNKISAAYTFDAGPNACILLESQDVPIFASLVKHLYPKRSDESDYFRGLPAELASEAEIASFIPSTEQIGIRPDSLKYVIQTRLGDGAMQLFNDHLPY